MCGRYYVDDETAKEIARLVRDISDQYTSGKCDIHPDQTAEVICGSHQQLDKSLMQWGFPGYEGGKLIFNARSETVMEKRMFADSARHRRCIIPAAGFYEWDRHKDKASFYRQDQQVLYMAGIFQRYEQIDRFVILTTQASASVLPVHSRMPLVLEPHELTGWVFDESRAVRLLEKQPVELARRQDYEQLSLF